MSRRGDRAVERMDPSMAAVVRASVGDATAVGALHDRAEELGLHPGGGLLLDRLEVGKNYWITTQTFPVVGKLVSKGIDYVELDSAALVLVDGRTSTLMRTGRAPNMEVEPIGDGVFVAVDQFGFARLWQFPLFAEAV